jgi:hypothetical protein
MIDSARGTFVASANNVRFHVRERWTGITIVHHVAGDGDVWATSGRRILQGKPGDWRVVASFPRSWPRDLCGWWRPLARAGRADKCNVYVNRAGHALGIRGGCVYHVHQNRMSEVGRIQGDCVLHGGITEDEQGWTYFGEYFRNRERGIVRIWRTPPDLCHCEVAHEFLPGEVRHVHGIYRDPYDNAALWFTVGDYAGECHLGRTQDRFESVELYGDGTQMWRAVRLFFTPEHVCWLTDSHIEQNVACRMSRSGAALEIGQQIPCSAWYGTTTRDGLHVAFTTVEAGPAIQRNESSVLVSQDAFTWSELACFQKDWWKPFRLFKYGVISCPSGEMDSDDLLISGEGLIGFDGVSLRVSLDDADDAVREKLSNPC